MNSVAVMVASQTKASVLCKKKKKLEEKFLLEKETEAEAPPSAMIRDESTETEEILVHPAYPDQLPSDMTGVPRWIAEHKLNVNVHDRPVAQKKRFFSEEKNQAINKDVEEWLKAGIIRPVRYATSISNPLLVKKALSG
ncbi:TO45-2 [Artemisia annua]|uniref:TO45-2 n=1 Tax=Artemisia annua TaxID=35608 RepID=A0A2U1LCR6_ARTAN|nr:TO45-2 [Artemisia annua]